MKLSVSQLRNIIKEEVTRMLVEEEGEQDPAKTFQNLYSNISMNQKTMADAIVKAMVYQGKTKGSVSYNDLDQGILKSIQAKSGTDEKKLQNSYDQMRQIVKQSGQDPKFMQSVAPIISKLGLKELNIFTFEDFMDKLQLQLMWGIIKNSLEQAGLQLVKGNLDTIESAQQALFMKKQASQAPGQQQVAEARRRR